MLNRELFNDNSLRSAVVQNLVQFKTLDLTALTSLSNCNPAKGDSLTTSTISRSVVLLYGIDHDRHRQQPNQREILSCGYKST
jgi:hypothetical protein